MSAPAERGDLRIRTPVQRADSRRRGAAGARRQERFPTRLMRTTLIRPTRNALVAGLLLATSPLWAQQKSLPPTGVRTVAPPPPAGPVPAQPNTAAPAAPPAEPLLPGE